jgi:LEA14-like dessication related protein
MGAKKIIFLFFGGAAAWWIWQKYNFSQKVQFKIAGISIEGSLLNPQIILSIALINPTKTSTTISNITAELFLNGYTKIADVFFNEQIEILPNSQTILPLSINSFLSNIINTIKQLFIEKKGSFDLKGSAKVDGITIPFSINYKVS